MPMQLREQVNDGLSRLAQGLDISPTKYRQAVDRYSAVATYLENGTGFPGTPTRPSVYCQGSFRLGTVVRPLKDDKDADYDIDLVCQFSTPRSNSTCGAVKGWTGNRLKDSDRYSKLLEPEGRRCWTLDYAEVDGVGFHLDVLPCAQEDDAAKAQFVTAGVDSRYADCAIAITHRSPTSAGVYSYQWKQSNPEGFARWFHSTQRGELVKIAKFQKQLLLEQNRDLYESIDQVPDALVRTPLQRVVQLLKRHRDTRFKGHPDADFKPISMVITCLSALGYSGETDTLSALEGIVREISDFEPLLEMRTPLGKRRKLHQIIQRGRDGKWLIRNPVDPGENFADRWHEDGDARARAFFQWIDWVRADVLGALSQETLSESVSVLSRGFGKERAEAAFTPSSEQRHSGPVVSVPNIVISNPPRPWSHE